VHVQVPGLLQVPLFEHVGEHTAKKQEYLSNRILTLNLHVRKRPFTEEMKIYDYCMRNFRTLYRKRVI
jgi:hypothetical protein